MPVVSCPACAAKVQIEDRDLAFDVECPYCQKIFPGTPPAPRRRDPDVEDTTPFGFRDEPVKSKMPRRPSGSRYDDEDDDDRYDDRPRRRRSRYDDDDDYYDDDDLIADAKKAVFWPALLSILLSSLGIFLAIVDIAMLIGAPQQMKQGNPFIAQMSDEALIGIRVAAIVWESIILGGSICMIRLKAYGFAKAAMVMRIIPFAGLCCIIGFIFGILGVVALNKADVKEAFELANRDRD